MNTKLPQALNELADRLIFSNNGGGIVAKGDNIYYWYNSWVGDAPGNDPHETTADAARMAEEEIIAVGGIVQRDTYYIEHDHAQFDFSFPWPYDEPTHEL